MSRKDRRSWRRVRLVAIFGASALVLACHTAPLRKGPVIAVTPTCQDFNVSIYFDTRSAILTRDALNVIDAAARRTVGCSVTGVNVLGLSDAPGDPGANLTLSKRRADEVAEVLAGRGLKKVEFQVTGAGEEGSQTRSGEARPLRRRADVQFHMMNPPAPAGH